PSTTTKAIYRIGGRGKLLLQSQKTELEDESSKITVITDKTKITPEVKKFADFISNHKISEQLAYKVTPTQVKAAVSKYKSDEAISEQSREKIAAKRSLAKLPKAVLENVGYKIEKNGNVITVSNKDYDASPTTIPEFLTYFNGLLSTRYTTNFPDAFEIVPTIMRYKAVVDLDKKTIIVETNILDSVNGKLAVLDVHQESKLKLSGDKYVTEMRKNFEGKPTISKFNKKKIESFLSGQMLQPENDKTLLPFAVIRYNSGVIDGFLNKEFDKKIASQNLELNQLPTNIQEMIGSNSTNNYGQPTDWPSDYYANPIKLENSDLKANVMDGRDIIFTMFEGLDLTKVYLDDNPNFNPTSTEPMFLKYITQEYLKFK
ncbi:MAG: hypothetical protein LBM27_02100, partial [Lactobacillaceae bacterium]|nr:hypothetical protein [Lactobacillaceae bacterium]